MSEDSTGKLFVSVSEGEFTCLLCGGTFPCEVVITSPGSAGIRPTVCENCTAKVQPSDHVRIDHDEMLRRQWEVICPPGFRDRCETVREKLPQPDRLDKVLAWEYGPRGLILHGPTGTGKSRCAWALLRKLHFSGIHLEAWDSGDWVNECSKRYGEYAGEEWVEKMIRCKLLFLDDLGAEAAGERGEGELVRVIKRRGEEELPIIATTNKVRADFANRAHDEDRGAAMARRLSEFCQSVRFGPNEA